MVPLNAGSPAPLDACETFIERNWPVRHRGRDVGVARRHRVGLGGGVRPAAVEGDLVAEVLVDGNGGQGSERGGEQLPPFERFQHGPAPRSRRLPGLSAIRSAGRAVRHLAPPCASTDPPGPNAHARRLITVSLGGSVLTVVQLEPNRQKNPGARRRGGTTLVGNCCGHGGSAIWVETFDGAGTEFTRGVVAGLRGHSGAGAARCALGLSSDAPGGQLRTESDADP